MLFATARRQVVPELMDSPTLDEHRHMQALAGLQRVNAVSRTGSLMTQSIGALTAREKLSHLTLLDVACGGGDVPVEVAERLKACGVITDLTLFDRSLTALGRAAALARNKGIVAHAASGDAPGGLPQGPFDIVTSSLFLHHLNREQVVSLLGEIHLRARRMVVISDLRRSTAGYVVAWAGCRMLSRSPIVHHDGPASVRAAWTVEELDAMAREAGLSGARIRRGWPWRMTLMWERGM